MRAAGSPNVGSAHARKGQSSSSNPGPLSLCVLMNLEACLCLSEPSGLARDLELGGGDPGWSA